LLQRGHFASSIAVIIALIRVINKQCLDKQLFFLGAAPAQQTRLPTSVTIELSSFQDYGCDAVLLSLEPL
jgi:hypothetical protein